MSNNSPFLRKLPKTKDTFIKLTVILLSVLLITALFPHEKKFKYEFQKGKPWMHEVLIAPFDFPIYKSEAELKAEKDSMIGHYKHYFNIDTGKKASITSHFRNDFNQHWDEFLRETPAAKNVNKDDLFQKSLNILETIYDQGIAENIEQTGRSSKKSGEIMILRGKVAEAADFSSFFSQKSAYEFIQKQIQKLSDNVAARTGANIQSFFDSFQFENYISPNILYDENMSRKIMGQEIQQISETKGMIQAGERIIFTGDVVTERSFQKLESLKKEYEAHMGRYTEHIGLMLGQLLIVALIIALLFLHLIYFRSEIFESTLRTSFLFFIIALFCVITRIVLGFTPSAMVIIPVAMFVVIIRTFYDARMANYTYFTLILILGFWAPNSFEYIFISFIAGVTANLSLSKNFRRGKLFITAILVFIAYTLSYSAYTIITEGNLKTIDITVISNFAVNSLLILSAMPVIYIMEKLFGFVSDATLLELSDTNQPLLRQMAEEAPGTFQHSLQVANLAEEAVFRIGGNPLLIRAGALYHDIGKLYRPIFFTENQRDEINPHNEISLEDSAAIIIGHVERGVAIALKHKLPKQIIDFIRTHHGVTTAKYFYRTYQKLHPDALVNRDMFSYPGPQPFSKEMAVLMMADAVEAASRSLKSFDDTSVSVLVDGIVNDQMQSGQFNDANITFAEVTTVKALFKRRLAIIHHKRIEYPKAAENEQLDKDND